MIWLHLMGDLKQGSNPRSLKSEDQEEVFFQADWKPEALEWGGSNIQKNVEMGKLKSPLRKDAEESQVLPPCAKKSCQPMKKTSCFSRPECLPRVLGPQVVILGRGAEGSWFLLP